MVVHKTKVLENRRPRSNWKDPEAENPASSGINENLLPRLKDINLGICLISIYFIFEFGSFQGLFPFINHYRLPFILTILLLAYGGILIISNRVDWCSATTRSFLLVCLFVILYTVLATKDPLAKVDLVKVFLGFMAHYFIITASAKRPSQFLLLLDIWLFCVMFSSFHAIRQGGLVWGNRWLKDENHISLLVATAMPFAFILFNLTVFKLRKIFYLMCMAFYLAANVIAASRGGALGMGLVLLLCCLLTQNKKRNLSILLISCILVLSLAPEKFFREMDTLEQGTQEATAADRIYLWGIGLKMFYDHPILGVGPMNYAMDFSKYEKGVRYKLGSRRVVHSTQVQWLAEKGLIGVLILLLLQRALYANWKTVYKREGRKNLQGNEDRDFLFIKGLANATAIAQVGFWFCAMFLSLLPYPFYWVLVPFSEVSRNIANDYMKTEVYNTGH